MTRPYWLNDSGRIVDFGQSCSQHVRDYYHNVSLERMRAFRSELHRHGSSASAIRCLINGGCIAPCDHFRNEYISQLSEFAEVRRGAVPVTPPLCPMGGTPAPKSLKKYTDEWRQNRAD